MAILVFKGVALHGAIPGKPAEHVTPEMAKKFRLPPHRTGCVIYGAGPLVSRSVPLSIAPHQKYGVNRDNEASYLNYLEHGEVVFGSALDHQIWLSHERLIRDWDDSVLQGLSHLPAHDIALRNAQWTIGEMPSWSADGEEPKVEPIPLPMLPYHPVRDADEILRMTMHSNYRTMVARLFHLPIARVQFREQRAVAMTGIQKRKKKIELPTLQPRPVIATKPSIPSSQLSPATLSVSSTPEQSSGSRKSLQGQPVVSSSAAQLPRTLPPSVIPGLNRSRGSRMPSPASTLTTPLGSSSASQSSSPASTVRELSATRKSSAASTVITSLTALPASSLSPSVISTPSQSPSLQPVPLFHPLTPPPTQLTVPRPTPLPVASGAVTLVGMPPLTAGDGSSLMRRSGRLAIKSGEALPLSALAPSASAVPQKRKAARQLEPSDSTRPEPESHHVPNDTDLLSEEVSLLFCLHVCYASDNKNTACTVGCRVRD